MFIVFKDLFYWMLVDIKGKCIVLFDVVFYMVKFCGVELCD